MLVAAGTSGVAGYVVLVLAARVLDPATNAAFLVFWGAMFAVFGALVGLTTETTRAVFSSRGTGSTAVLPAVLGLAGTVAFAVGVSGLVWAPLLFGDPWPSLLAAMVVGIVLFGLQQGLNGAAAGTSAWNAYSLFVGSEAVMRLVLCALVVVAGGHLLGLAWAVALACGTWVGWLLLRRDHRRLVHVRVAGTAPGWCGACSWPARRRVRPHSSSSATPSCCGSPRRPRSSRGPRPSSCPSPCPGRRCWYRWASTRTSSSRG